MNMCQANGIETGSVVSPTALQFSGSGDAWQPIATALTDRTEMLGYRPDQGVFLFRYASMEEVVPTDEYGDPLGDFEDHEGWWHEQWGWLDGWDAPQRTGCQNLFHRKQNARLKRP